MVNTNKKWIGSGINSNLKESVNNNVLNVVRALVEDPESIVYIPDTYFKASKYRASADPAVHFLPTECGKAVRVIGIQSHQERFNFSVTGLVDVIVEYPNEDGTIDLKDKKIFRQYNIIRDGELTVDYLSAKLSTDSFEALRDIDILYYNGIKVESNHNHNPSYVYKIVLKDLPLVSVNWAQPNRIGLVQFMNKENQLALKIKVLKTLKKEYESLDSFKSPYSGTDSEIYSEKLGSYSSTDVDSKEVNCVTYSIKNLDKFEYSIEDARSEYSDYASVDSAISLLNKELKYSRFIIRSMTYSIESTKQRIYEWSEPKQSSRSTKVSQETLINVEGTDYTLVRTTYTKKF